MRVSSPRVGYISPHTGGARENLLFKNKRLAGDQKKLLISFEFECVGRASEGANKLNNFGLFSLSWFSAINLTVKWTSKMVGARRERSKAEGLLVNQRRWHSKTLSSPLICAAGNISDINFRSARWRGIRFPRARRRVKQLNLAEKSYTRMLWWRRFLVYTTSANAADWVIFIFSVAVQTSQNWPLSEKTHFSQNYISSVPYTNSAYISLKKYWRLWQFLYIFLWVLEPTMCMFDDVKTERTHKKQKKNDNGPARAHYFPSCP